MSRLVDELDEDLAGFRMRYLEAYRELEIRIQILEAVNEQLRGYVQSMVDRAVQPVAMLEQLAPLLRRATDVVVDVDARRSHVPTTERRCRDCPATFMPRSYNAWLCPACLEKARLAAARRMTEARRKQRAGGGHGDEGNGSAVLLSTDEAARVADGG